MIWSSGPVYFIMITVWGMYAWYESSPEEQLKGMLLPSGQLVLYWGSLQVGVVLVHFVQDRMEMLGIMDLVEVESRPGV